MKKDKHPEYQEVVFVDSSTGAQFLCGTTLKTREKVMYNGKEYPAYHVSVSSKSHPFYLGGQQFIDTEGRIDKFRQKYNKVNKPKEA